MRGNLVQGFSNWGFMEVPESLRGPQRLTEDRLIRLRTIHLHYTKSSLILSALLIRVSSKFSVVLTRIDLIHFAISRKGYGNSLLK